MCDFFFKKKIIILLFLWKLVKFAFNYQNTNLSHEWYFLKCMIFFSFFINTLLFFQNTVKFSTNCWNISFSWLIFNKCRIFFYASTLFHWKSAKFMTNFRNINFARKWYFLNMHFFFFFDVSSIISQKIGKISDKL